MKIKHYSTFSEDLDTLFDPHAWEKLRNSAADSSYFLPFTMVDYIKKVDVSQPSAIATGIISLAEKLSINNIFSIGSGIAALEYQVKRFSNLKVTVSDCNRSVLRLRSFNIFDEVLVFDALKESMSQCNDSIVVFPRIDTEFDDEQLKKLFEKCYFANVPVICFIPAQLISVRVIIGEIKILAKSWLSLKKRTFCGYSRSLNHFIKLFSRYYTIEDRDPDNSILYLKRMVDKV